MIAVNIDSEADRPLDGLLIGTASAATQIEGGDRNHNWYEWAQRPGNIADDTSPMRATDHWNRWRQDNELMHQMGFPIVRLGLEWSRIEPEPGRYSSEALDHYREEIGHLVDLGIRPLVTLHHFSNPLWLQRMGQFTNAAAVPHFLGFVRVAVNALRDLVDEWVTINEPNVYAVEAHLFRGAPPGNRSLRDVRAVLRHMAIAHGFAYRLIHELDADATVTFAHHVRPFEPVDPANPVHLGFARLNSWAFQDIVTDAFGLGQFPAILGRAPFAAGLAVDVAGLNYYSRSAVTTMADGTFPGSPVNDLGWEIHAPGLVECARGLHERLGVPVWVTENGTCDNGDAQRLERFRPRYLAEHLAAILDSDVPIERYYHWCFVDNFEWSEGESSRFGLVHNDYETQTRTVKPSGHMLSDVIRAGALTPEIIERYTAGQSYPTAVR